MNKRSLIVSLFIFLAGVVVYWSTAYPSITWWETSEYAGAAVGPGISGPPGSLLLTLAGWLLSKLSPGNPAFLFNLFAGVTGSLAVVLCYLSFKKVKSAGFDDEPEKLSFPEDLMIVIGSGVIICSSTIWEYSIMFAPYILTGLFTVLILLSVLYWLKRSERKDSWKQLFLIALLFGIDFSVHRTNAVLMPGVLLLVLINRPKVFLDYRSYLAVLAGLFLGLSIQLLYIPISLRDPSMNMGEPNNLAGWWYYFSLKQYGGNFLLDILTRKSPLLSYQVPYYLKGFSNNFFYFDQKTIIPGFIPGLLGFAGIFALYRKNKRVAISLISFLILTIIVSIIYFNLPANYFRSIYRHYLPTFIIFSVLIFYGLDFVVGSVKKLSNKTRWALYSVLFVLLCATFFNQYRHNIAKNNGAGNNFTSQHAMNLINSIEQGGIVFNYADNDYFPEIYLQEAKKIRTDIIHCNLSLLNADWYINQVLRHHRDFPFRVESVDIKAFGFTNWQRKNITITLSEETRKRYGTDKDSVIITFPALRTGNSNYLQDVVLFDVIRNNRWEKPLYFIKGGIETELYKWLRPYLRDEGLVYKFVPDTLKNTDITKIMENLGKFDLRGYSDSSVMLDEMSMNIGRRYYDLYLQAALEKVENGEFESALHYIGVMKEKLPFQRLRPDQEIIDRTVDLNKLSLEGKQTHLK